MKKIAQGLLIATALVAVPTFSRAQVVRPVVAPANRLPAGGILRPETVTAPTAMPTGEALQAAIAGAAAKRRRVPTGVHTMYGTIVSLSANALELKLRGGRIVPVQTAFAIASDNYSAPLFVGKTVAVDGTVNASGSLAAAHIFRVEGMSSLPIDK